MLLSGKTALITGAARGIGKAIAKCFAEEGADIAITDLAYDEVAQETEKELLATGVKAKAYASNAADFENAQAIVQQVAEDFGHIDILVNNAGITRDGLLMRMTEAQWDMVINVNLKSVFCMTKAVQPLMLRQRGGSIINISSVVGLMGNKGQANYAAAKAGVIGLTKTWAKEFARKGVPVRVH